jgi:hypothetical protein
MAGPWEKYGQQPGFVPLTGPDQLKIKADERADAAQRRADEANTRAAEAAQRAAANEAARLTLEREKFEQTQREAVNPALSGTEKAAAIAGYNSADAIDKLVKDIEEKFAAGPGKTTGLKGLRDFLPSTVNDQFDTAGQSVRGQVGTALGFTGGQLNSPIEAKMAVGPYIPQASDRDATIKDKIKRLKDLAQQARQRSIQVLGGIPDVNGNITPVQADQRSLATGATRNVPDPKANALVTRLVRAGVSDSEINAALQDIGAPPVEPGSLKAIRAFEHKHPGANYSGATRQEQTSFLNRMAASPAANFVGNMGVAGSAGLPLAMAGQDAKDAFNAANEANPGSSLFGSAVGGVSAAVGGGKLLGATKLAPWIARNPRIAALTGDMLYGGTTGAASADDGNEASGALAGAGGAFLGNRLGAGVAKAAGGALRGVVDPAVDYLRSQGIPLTGGQMMGGFGKRMEDTLAGYGLAGAPLRNRLTEGLEALNRVGYRIGGSPIGHVEKDIGRAGLDGLDAAKSVAYDTALGSMNMNLDPPYFADRAIADASGAALPDAVRPFYDATMGAADSYVRGGNIPGRSAQAIKRTIREEMRSHKGKPGGQFINNALGQADSAFMDMAARQAPDATALYRAADLTHGRSKVLGKAVDAASGKPGDPGVWTGAQLASALKGGRVTQDARNALGPLAENAVRVLPSQVPDSGTAGRLALGALAAGSPLAIAGYGAGGQDGAETGGALGIGTILSLAALNTKAGRTAAEKLLLDRPEIMRRFGTGLIGKAGLFGGAGLGAGANLGGLLAN